MGDRKKQGGEEDRQQSYLRCSICGRKVKPDGCSWQEDDEGLYCQDCRAERESCGCSD